MVQMFRKFIQKRFWQNIIETGIGYKNRSLDVFSLVNLCSFTEPAKKLPLAKHSYYTYGIVYQI